MKLARTPIIAWILLLFAAMTIGSMAIFLLQKQQASLSSMAGEARRVNLETEAATINLTVTETRESLASELAMLSDPGLLNKLENWRLSNPLIRNVFLWGPGDKLIFPNPSQPTSSEEEAFCNRYASLFSGQHPWASPGKESDLPSGQFQARRELTQLAKTAPTAESSAAASPASGITTTGSGWLPWFWEDSLHLLLWQQTSDGRRFGIELEMAALLSRLVTILPPLDHDQQSLALLDDRGNIVHQSGSIDLSESAAQVMTVPIGGSLPHWQLGLYSNAIDAQGETTPYLLVGGLLTLILVCTILLGGSLLLWQARQGLRDARRKTGFVANVSHELKTPLTSIRMYAEMLEESPQIGEERRMRYLNTIGSEARRLTRLVNNLLDFSRLEQGRKNYRVEQTDLHQLVERVATSQRPRFQNLGLNLQLTLDQGEILIDTDSDAVEQALLNLIDNAVKYAAAGKIVQVEMKREDNQVEIAVSDRGPGIPAAQREKVFEMFHRIDNSLTRQQQGCGLGLSIARQLLRDLGGDLRYDPRQGGGASFIIVLPLNRPTA